MESLQVAFPVPEWKHWLFPAPFWPVRKLERQCKMQQSFTISEILLGQFMDSLVL